MKKQKRYLALILSVATLFTMMAFPASAQQTLFQRVHGTVSDMLVSIEADKEGYGLADVDFSTLALGNEIPAYDLENGQLSPAETHYFPVLSNGNWVATAVATEQNGEVFVQFGRMYADGQSLTQAALVFDQGTVYEYGANNTRTVAYTKNDAAVPNSMSASATAILQPQTAAISAQRTLQSTYSVFATRDVDDHYLAVPMVAQPTDYTCWAACCVAICRYFNISATIDEIVSLGGSSVEAGLLANALSALNAKGLDPTSSQSFAWATMMNHILQNRPIYAGCLKNVINGIGTGHAVVIRGFASYGNSSPNGYRGLISYMDPEYGSYVSSAVPSSGFLYYIGAGSTTSYPFTDFAAIDN